MTGLGLLTLLLPFQYYTTQQKVASGSSSNETGLGAQYEWFAAPTVSLGGAYVANLNVGERALVFSGFDLGFQHYLTGGAPESFASQGTRYASVGKQHLFYGLALGRKSFDFQAFDKTRDAPVVEGPRPITSGDIFGPCLRLGWEFSVGQRFRVGLRGLVFEGLASNVDIRIRTFEAQLTVGVTP